MGTLCSFMVMQIGSVTIDVIYKTENKILNHVTIVSATLRNTLASHVDVLRGSSRILGPCLWGRNV